MSRTNAWKAAVSVRGLPSAAGSTSATWTKLSPSASRKLA